MTPQKIQMFAGIIRNARNQGQAKALAAVAWGYVYAARDMEKLSEENEKVSLEMISDALADRLKTKRDGWLTKPLPRHELGI